MDITEALRARGIGNGKRLIGDAQPADVRVGKTFSNAQGNQNEGTLPIRSLVAQTITPGANNIIKQAGIYDGDITIEGDPDLVPQNIKLGVSIFGVVGNMQEKRFASGNMTVDLADVVVTGLAFPPAFILISSLVGAAAFRKLYSTAHQTYLNNFTYYKPGASATTAEDSGAWTITANGFSTKLRNTTGTATVDWIAYE